MKIFVLFLALFASTFLTAGDKRPEAPTLAGDAALLDAGLIKKGANKVSFDETIEFFDARKNNKACQKLRIQNEIAYLDSLENLKKAIREKAPNIAALELDVNQKRTGSGAIEMEEKCGRCATRDTKNPIVKDDVPEKLEVWSVMDASCLTEFPADTKPEAAEKILNDVSQSLLTLSEYPKNFDFTKKHQGISQVLDFLGYNEKERKFDRSIDKVTESPFKAFIAVSAGIFLPGSVFTYFFKNEFKARKEKEHDDFFLRFTTTTDEKPPEFERLVVEDVRANGKRTKLKRLNLPTVDGLWYLARFAKGTRQFLYSRYYTASDFEPLSRNLPGGAKLATELGSAYMRTVLLNTTIQLAERGRKYTRAELVKMGENL